MIELSDVVYDRRARDGTWCMLPYPNHPKGCPKFPKCPLEHIDLGAVRFSDLKWFAVIEEFDLKAQAKKMQLRFPKWSDRKCRNLIYWQKGVMSRLYEKACSPMANLEGDILLDIPEACGVNVFETMAKVGIVIDRHPDIVRKVMLVGKRKE